MGLKVKQADWLVKNVYHIDPTHVFSQLTALICYASCHEILQWWPLYWVDKHGCWIQHRSVVLCSMSLGFVSFGDSWFNQKPDLFDVEVVPLIISGEIMVLKPLYCSKNGLKLISDIVSLLLLDIWRISSYEDEIIPISYYIAGNAHLVWRACLLMSAESKLLLGMSHVDQTGKCPWS